MSHAGDYYRQGVSLFKAFEERKPHSSITDWIEVLSSDRYEELSLDGIPELVESVNILGASGTAEAARAIRKKLKYGNVHRQLRALVILRALTENAGKGFKLNWADSQIMGRLKEMAGDSLLDPKVKKRLILVFHAWSIQYADDPRMMQVASLYKTYGHAPGTGPGVRKASTIPHEFGSATSPTSPTSPRRIGGFDDYDDLYNHSWAPSKRGADTYADLASAKADAEQRKMERDRQIALEQREAEIERKEREYKRRQEMAAIENRRAKEAEEEAERRRQAKAALKNRPSAAAEPKRPKFDLAKEKPQVLVAIANALQAASALVNSCRHINREYENVLESPRVQENLDKAKAARRAVIRYLQLVQEETLVGTLLEANEKVVEAIQLYDKLSKPAALDSDSEHETTPAAKNEPPTPSEMERLTERMRAQKLEADRKTELQKLQEQQKRESARRQQKQSQPPPRPSRQAQTQSSAHPDLQDLDFGSIANTSSSRGLPTPLTPDSERGSFTAGSLSDFSDYDSSDPEDYHYNSRRPSAAYPARKQSGPSASHSKKPSQQYYSLDDEFDSRGGGGGSGSGSKGGKSKGNPFGDPFADEDNDTPVQEKPRMQWAEI